MQRSTSDTCTVLIASPGRLPITLMVKPKALFLVAAIALVSPLAWLGSRVYSLHRQNQELTAQNQALSQAANDVFREIEVLDTEIDLLRERAGLDEDALLEASPTPEGSPQSSVLVPQGGPSAALEPAEAFEEAKKRLPALTSALDQQVKPALNETLAEEFARANAVPSVRPVKADLEISSKFGIRRNPFGWGYEMHNGIDFAGPVGTPIYATAPGTTTKADWGRGYGYHVILDHGYGYETLYAHLSELKVVQGDKVDRNDVVGLMGNTGRSTGTHLHYSVYKNGKLVDPANYLD
ncbi:MAG: peptidoglycan DD-metalloendopeptidase family protein [Cyanothece sp. SIO2G6]|nr:peptidoglycan DD-metalloendopeptidase family protein [Cyanothece sp. SIO2G6]